ncbi:hypothetical protein F5984_04000 [Rudanella paleaurantiibacter]|uniref:Lipoprotein n=1 Tax=Rudanella paleaurantiibacter TaxID=2614655 RepID=A0A7J5U7H5_9BACT|nr:hypothetical protein [Rudanella paleaurantiibacter]KAB7733110.1 hypothetical protein F5984_04000 [Rudanella paleaurantiibacter]
MKRAAIFGFWVLPLLMGCQSDAVDGQLTMAPGEWVKLSNGATLRVGQVTNSLCPPGGVCITGGKVTVVMSIDAVSDTLCLGPDCGRYAKGEPSSRVFETNGRSTAVTLLGLQNLWEAPKRKAVLTVH